jgi:hypothetical protein
MIIYIHITITKSSNQKKKQKPHRRLCLAVTYVIVFVDVVVDDYPFFVVDLRNLVL